MRTTVSRGIGRSAAVAAAVVAGLGAGFTATASADQSAAAEPWSVSHGGGTGEGTSSYVKTGTLTGDFVVDGTLRVDNSNCYFARIVVTHDLAPAVYDTPQQCGTGTKPIDKTISVFSVTWGATIAICETDGECGQARDITVYG